MTNRDLIIKLNNLKNINPDQNWLKSNRELLLTQISNSSSADLSSWKIVLINLKSVMQAVSRPAFALGAFIFILIAGSLFSRQIFAKTKPNDSLYIARIISEKVKLNTMFNSEERDKLSVQFASEHAQDITTVLADPHFNTEANQDQVAKLNDSFNREVDTVKNKINRINRSSVAAPSQPTDKINDVMIADSSKEAQGIQLFENPDNIVKPTSSVINASTTLNETANLNLNADSLNATSGSSTVASSTLETENAKLTDKPAEVDKILDEVKQLFSQKDYGGAKDKLKEVDEIIK